MNTQRSLEFRAGRITFYASRPSRTTCDRRMELNGMVTTIKETHVVYIRACMRSCSHLQHTCKTVPFPRHAILFVHCSRLMPMEVRGDEGEVGTGGGVRRACGARWGPPPRWAWGRGGYSPPGLPISDAPAKAGAGGYIYIYIYIFRKARKQLEVLRVPFRDRMRGGESERGRYTNSLGEALPLHSLHFGFLF